jgi:hypothetical protein
MDPNPSPTRSSTKPAGLGTTLNLAANNLDVTFKAGSRDYGLNASNADGKISELSLKKKYA